MLIVSGLLKAGLILTVGLITIDDWKFVVTTYNGFSSPCFGFT